MVRRVVSTDDVGKPGERLLHGTPIANQDAILRDGLALSDEHAPIPYTISLTDWVNQARVNAWRRGTDGVVFTVDVSGLPLDRGGHVTCLVPIGPERIIKHTVVKRP
jgi:hypothetical protein